MKSLVAFSMLALAAPVQLARAQDVTVQLTAALVEGLDVRRIPRLGIRVLKGDSVVTEMRTSLDGTARFSLPAGSYRVVTPSGLSLNGTRYMWDVPLDITRARGEHAVELANDNAAVSRDTTTKATPTAPAATTSPEQAIFRRVRSGVFRVESGLGHGTGFLTDALDGVVVTNDHVVANEALVSVYLDSATRVVAQVVARDRASDLAILRIPRARCGSCARLPLAARQAGQPLVDAGDRVLAIGFPLSQELTLTTGIVSSVRDGAIISDVNINPGNSGGPLIDVRGVVVGINTFGDASDRGPGISGSVSVDRLQPLLEQARSALASMPPLEDQPLVARPTHFYPTAAIRAIADSATTGAYRHVLSRTAGNFEVRMSTPVITMIRRRLAGDVLGGERRRREAAAGVAGEDRYSTTKDARDWEQYAGSERVPLIGFSIEPMLGESFWSAFGRGLEQAQYGVAISQAKMRVRGDVRGARFYRNGVEVTPLFGGHAPVQYFQNDRWIELRDVADRGYYLLPPELFAPDDLGRPALVTVIIQDLKNPGTMSAVDYFGETSARMWNDFAPYFTSRGLPTRIVDSKLSSPAVPLVCSSRTGMCTPKQ